MKNLTLLNQDTSVKLNDTGTLIQFKASNNNTPVYVTDGENAEFRIKNTFGFVKSVDASTTFNGFIFEINTKDLDGLVPGTYQVELAITDKDNETVIFPDDGFVSFKISDNALNLTGQQVSTLNLDDFKKQALQYMENTADDLKNNFNDYVASVKTGPAGKNGTDGANGKNATIKIGNVTTVDSDEEATVTNSGTDTDAILNFSIPKGENGETAQGATVKVGNVNTLGSGEKATITNSGTATNAVFDFGIPTGPQGPKGDTGASSTVNVDTADTYTPWTAWDSQGTTYSKGYIGNDGNENPGNATDVYTDYIECYKQDMYTISLPGNLLPFPQGAALRVAWYDTNKNFISAKEVRGITPPYAWTVSAPQNAKYMRCCFYVGNNANASGTNPHVFITDIGHSTATNNGTSTDANIKFSVASGSQGIPGLQGAVGPQGPQGTIGDYVTGTGWVDLSPYMNTDVWCGWDSNTPSDIGYNKYAVTSINGQNIFWFRIHSRFKDASVAGKWGTKLFTIPVDVQKQYGGMEQSQYQGGLYECNGQPCLSQVVGDANARYVQTRGALQMSASGDNTSKLTGTVAVNMEGWYIL